ncbi:hypothetical protein [Rhizobium sp. MHM7A]|uniref:hypothetical protein n=1 Tax=Rhizobium sp. MHM7A TaxID=2583233 RepID=UPI0011061427|nr:hypothetical protein [Rhizobium sp. MHM7A]TLX16409.1 hypothetical protein FFR93_03490 [Rhizobium sp. MHM7A]
MTAFKMKSREQRLVEAALEIVFLEPKQETKVSLPVQETLYSVLKLPDGPTMLAVDINEALDVIILPIGYTTSVGRVTFARMDWELNNLGNRRHYNETLEVDPTGRTWAYRSNSNIELSFAHLADDALCDANVVLKNQPWLKDEDKKDRASRSAETAANFARDFAQSIVQYYSGKLALSGPETSHRAVASPVYEFFISEAYIEALCHDKDAHGIQTLEVDRFCRDEWVRNCLTLPLYEFEGVVKLIEAMSATETRTVCNHHDFVSLEARALLMKQDTSENPYAFLETALMELVGHIEQYKGIYDDPERADVIKSIKNWEGFSPIHRRAAASLHHHVAKLKAFVDTDFNEDFEFTLLRSKWELKISPLEVILIRLAGIIALFNDIDALEAGLE